MGLVLSDGIIQQLNNAAPATQNALLGTVLDQALAGVLPSGSITTAELVDGILSADTAGRAKMASGYIQAVKLASDAVETAKIKDGNVTAVKLASDAVENAKIKNDAVTTAKVLDGAITPAKMSVQPFMASADLTSAAAATPVDLIPNASVPTGKKIYIHGFIILVGGATAWTDITATIVSIVDKAGSPVTAIAVAKAGLIGNAVICTFDNANVTLGTGVSQGLGMTAEKGLSIVADANFAAGDTITCTVWGVIK